LGNIQLSREQLDDHERLYLEAVNYAVDFNRQEDSDKGFRIGCSDYVTNRAFVLSIEAARLLCSGGDGAGYAASLLKLTIEEISAAQAAEEGRRQGRSPMTIIDHANVDELEALLKRWQEHMHRGNLAFANAIYRSYTRGSPLGRLLSRFVLNPFARTLLRDAIESATGERPPLDDHPVADSPAAAVLFAQAPPRDARLTSHRKQPMQPDTLAAAISYAQERLALIAEADALVRPRFLWRRVMEKEQRSWRRLLALLQAERNAAPPPLRLVK
jgi:hypothetical protein